MFLISILDLIARSFLVLSFSTFYSQSTSLNPLASFAFLNASLQKRSSLINYVRLAISYNYHDMCIFPLFPMNLNKIRILLHFKREEKELKRFIPTLQTVRRSFTEEHSDSGLQWGSISTEDHLFWPTVAFQFANGQAQIAAR